MRPAFRPLTFNAVCLYLLAYLLTIVLHEGGHAAMALALGDHPVLYNTSVRTTSAHLTNFDHVLIAAAGPLLSLVQGLALLGWLHRHRPQGTGGLFRLYLGLFGLLNFLGYLLVAPFVAGGDTGQIVVRLHLPAAAVWVVATLALVVLVWAVGRTGPLLLGLLPTAEQARPELRTAGLRALLLWPWLLGSGVLVLLALPAPHPAVVANMFMSTMVLRSAYRMAQQAPVQPTEALELPRPQWLLLAGLVLAAIGFRLLALGVAL